MIYRQIQAANYRSRWANPAPALSHQQRVVSYEARRHGSHLDPRQISNIKRISMVMRGPIRLMYLTKSGVSWFS
jgi:hypothetical protein